MQAEMPSGSRAAAEGPAGSLCYPAGGATFSHVHVLSVERGRVKIGISAPAEVTVVRQELLEGKGTEQGGLTNPEAG
jgi:hypothetical protein